MNIKSEGVFIKKKHFKYIFQDNLFNNINHK
jgi:hypothetical protein